MPAPAGTRTLAGMIELPAIKRFAWRTRTDLSPPSSCRIERFTLADSTCPPVRTAPGASPQTRCIWQLVDHIDAHLGEALSVDQLARSVGLSRARHTRQTTGSDYLRDIVRQLFAKTVELVESQAWVSGKQRMKCLHPLAGLGQRFFQQIDLDRDLGFETLAQFALGIARFDDEQGSDRQRANSCG
jgi:AraC-like DNA-binding protein